MKGKMDKGTDPILQDASKIVWGIFEIVKNYFQDLKNEVVLQGSMKRLLRKRHIPGKIDISFILKSVIINNKMLKAI